MASWKENKMAGIVAGMIFLITLIFVFVQVNQHIQQRKKRLQEFEKWKGAPQAEKVIK